MPGFSPKQLRDRWHNYISPKNSFGPWTIEEDRFIVQNVKKYGTKWSLIASHLKGRSDNCVKNRWNTVLKEDQIIHPEKYFNLIIPEKNYQPMPPIQPPQPKPKEELYLDVRFVEHFFKPASKAEMERWTKGSASTVKI
ncbi:Myb-like DNA-binding domain containing protein [Trichomonas vaginalis G3]|uniref:Myb-like DNA-binding domain containing protein n=1 Tax=Trichomonas vaginalis (strain ATCC PRA-98 / G3) TaxID=412133 RepID=A2G343_TRIV3|nr:RNA polymerase II transcription regulator recruiting protein [Trichomonas vaginalis G3]EAX88423.1 Myb-like DNA-binding domain containing protein [Trichomonas vaginalis G3]KAI5505347.1 RNA polymerase II transcription regulator recruiting protein [Trichomonas vaginalis G3]|eukprot:XP_001301353.1 Myb-like DNA-binding domain containing protein [Trichomonas vaginalis G3]